jgi:uncharacterized protein YjbI with pentapeptide repeats
MNQASSLSNKAAFAGFSAEVEEDDYQPRQERRPAFEDDEQEFSFQTPHQAAALRQDFADEYHDFEPHNNARNDVRNPRAYSPEPIAPIENAPIENSLVEYASSPFAAAYSPPQAFSVHAETVVPIPSSSYQPSASPYQVDLLASLGVPNPFEQPAPSAAVTASVVESPQHYAEAPSFVPPPTMFSDSQQPVLELGIQEEIQAMESQHRLWLETAGRDGKRAVFRGDRFRGADFEGLFLPESTFRNTDLSASSFRGAVLDRADFTEAKLVSSDFTRASLVGAVFQRAQLTQADLSEVNAPEADFSQVEAIGGRFTSARLEQASLREMQCGETDFRNANLVQANLREASFFRARLDDVNLSYADCRGANFDSAVMNNAILTQTNFRDAALHNVIMQSADFSQAIDMPVEAQASSAQHEREALQQEAQRLDLMRAEMLARERELNQEREQLQQPVMRGIASEPQDSVAPIVKKKAVRGKVLDSLSHLTETQAMIAKSSKLFLKIGVAWLVMSLLVIALILNVVSEMDGSQINMMDLVFFLFILLSPVALCVVCVIKSMAISSRLLELAKESR